MEMSRSTDNETRATEELARYGLRSEPFSNAEKRVRKTPDRRVFSGTDFAFFFEVKEIAADPRMGVRSDPIGNRLTGDIHTAVKQFDSVNPDLVHPNVLAFINNDRMCGSLDLVGVFTGHLLLEGGGSAPIYLNYSEGRIKDEKNRIHLYLWLDSFKVNQKHFNFVDKRHLTRLCRYFGLKEQDIQIIGT